MTKKLKLYFLGYFIFFPLTFMLIYFIWMYLIKTKYLWDVLSNCTSIIGLYYIFTSIIFVFLLKKEVKESD